MREHTTSRRGFLRRVAGASVALPALARAGASPSDDVRVAVVGLGGIGIPGSVGGRGRQLLARLRQLPRGVAIAAICDVDRTVLAASEASLAQAGLKTAAHVDFRRVLDDKSVDAVFLATPNHWHALGTVWACQAGKDVYVEKPASYDIWEGRQIVAAARRHGRIVQVGTQRRSSVALPQAFASLRAGFLGPIRSAHALVYRARTGIGRVTEPTPVPASVDFDLWCGPAPKAPLRRVQLHYDWHWAWATGNGEIGNNGTHMIDICRWALGHHQPAPRVISIGARLAFDDDGETPNTHLALYDYQPAPLLCEIRNVASTGGKHRTALGDFRGADRGIVIVCEQGHFAGDYTGGTMFDRTGRMIREFRDPRKAGEIEREHLANFLDAVRTRDAGTLRAEAAVAHVSTVCSHMANVSHRLGAPASPASIRERIAERAEFADAFERCDVYLKRNGIDLANSPATLGPWIAYDATRERFTGEHARDAEHLSRRTCRAPYVVPELVA